MENDDKIHIVDVLLEESVRNAVSYYGIEGCEEAIHRVYSHNPTIKAKLLAVYTRIYKKK